MVGGAEHLVQHPQPGVAHDRLELSYYPLSLWSWQDAIKAIFDRVNIVANYDRAVHSPSLEMKLPSVVSLKTFVKPSTHPAFTRFNVFLRDRFSCQYCGTRDDLTFDHLLPRSRGGHTVWDNVVAACSPCNLEEGQPDDRRSENVAFAAAVPAVGAASAPQRAAVSAQLSTRQLARLSLLGHRTRSVIARIYFLRKTPAGDAVKRQQHACATA